MENKQILVDAPRLVGSPLILTVKDLTKIKVEAIPQGDDILYKLIDGDKTLVMQLNRPITFEPIMFEEEESETMWDSVWVLKGPDSLSVGFTKLEAVARAVPSRACMDLECAASCIVCVETIREGWDFIQCDLTLYEIKG